MDKYQIHTYLVLLCGLSILLFGSSLVGIWWSVQARNEGYNFASVIGHTVSGNLRDGPFLQTLDATSPLAMTLPADLTPYVGRVYHVWSTSAIAHTITSTVKWDGTNSVVTFGGAIGDGLVFAVVAPNRIVIETQINIALS